MIAVRKDDIEDKQDAVKEGVNVFTHDVETIPIFRMVRDQKEGAISYEQIDGFNGIQRKMRNNEHDKGSVVYVHPSSYYAIPLETLENIADAMLTCGYEVTGAGELKDGRVAFIELENKDLPKLSFDGTSLVPKMWIGTSHDGSIALKSTIKVVDTVCYNTFMLNARSDILFKTKHTQFSKVRLMEYKWQLEVAGRLIQEYYDSVKLLQNTSWDRHKNTEFFAEVLNAEKRPRKRRKNKEVYMTEPQYSKTHEKQMDDLWYSYENSAGQHERGHTAWRWFSAVTHWADNMISEREMRSGSNILNGTRARQKNRAFDIAREYATNFTVDK